MDVLELALDGEGVAAPDGTARGDAAARAPGAPAELTDGIRRALDRQAGLYRLWQDRARTRAYVLKHWERLHRRRAPGVPGP